MHIGIANPRWWGKRSRHSRRMHNPQFYASGKRPMLIHWNSLLSVAWLPRCSLALTQICEFATHSDCHLGHFQWTVLQMNSTGLNWWEVSIYSGVTFVLSAQNNITWSSWGHRHATSHHLITWTNDHQHLCRHTASLNHDELTHWSRVTYIYIYIYMRQ